MSVPFKRQARRNSQLRAPRTFRVARDVAAFALLHLIAFEPAALALPISYGGRLVDAAGAPLEGRVDVEINFYDAAESGSKLGSSPYLLGSTPLAQGIFSVEIELSDVDVAAIFRDPGVAVWIEVTDKGRGMVYPRQRFGIVPYALKIPVDSATLGFDESGQLKVLAAPNAGSVPNPLPAVDGAALTNVSASALHGAPVDAATPAVGQVLKWNGASWAPATDTDTDTSNSGTVTSVTAGSGLAGGVITGSGTISLAATLPAVDGSALTGVNAVKLQSFDVAGAAPAPSQVLKYNGTSWAPAADANSGGTVTSVTAGSGLAGGTITGSGTISLAATLPALDGSALTAVNAAKLQTIPLDATAPALSQVLKYDGTKWAPAADAIGSGTVTSVTAGSGLTGGTITGSGTLALASPMPALDGGALTNVSAAKIQGRTVSSAAPSNGQVLKWNSSSTTWEAAPDDGGVAGAISNGQNLGTSDASTADVYESTSAPSIRFRRLKEGAGVELTQNSDDVTVGIAAGGISAAELASDSVTSAQVAANAIATAEIADDAVTAAKILADAVGSAEIAAGAVTTSELLDGTIAGADISASAVLDIAAVGVAAQAGVTLAPYGAAAGNTGEARFKELAASGSNFVAMKAPDALAADVTFTLPDAAPASSGQVLSGTTAGVLSWTTLPSGLPPTGSAGGDLTGSFPNPTLAASGVSAGTYPKVTVDAKGRVTSGTSTITTTDIADATIANADISGSAAIATSKLSGAVTSISGHGLGSLATLSAVGSTEITDGAVANADISAAAAIATSKLSGAVTSISGHGLGSLATLSAVGSTEITNGAVADADISAAAAIATSKLSGAVTSISGHGLGSLATLSAVGSAQITDGQIADADISASAAIADTKLATIATAGKVSGAAITSGSIGGTASFGGSGGVSTSGSVAGTGNFLVSGTGAATTDLRFADNDNSNYVGFKAPGTVAANKVWVLPGVDGVSGDLLKTDGAGTLSWVSGSAPTGSAGGDLTGSFPNPTLAASGVSAGTYPKVTVDAKGRVTSGTSTITTTDIADATIANADISGSAAIATSKLSGAVTSISGHGLGSLATLSAVGSTEITDGAVANADISAAAAIATSKLSGAVTSISGHGLGSLATLSAVGSTEITDGAVANADISAAAAIATSKLSGAVTSISGHGLGSLATLSGVGSTEITDGAVANADISAAAAIATSKLSGAVTSISGHGLGSLATLSAVGSAQITDGQVTNADISGTAAIATSKLSGAVTSIAGHGLGSLATMSAVGSAQITDGQIADADISGTAAISSTKISFVADSISGNTIDGGIISNFASTGIDDNASSIAMTLASGGNVGIGTTTPSTAIDVESTAASAGLDINNTATDGDPRIAFQLSGTSAFTMGIDDSDSDKFKIGTTAIDTNTRLTIDGSGNVGIGTTSPSGFFEVQGGAAASGDGGSIMLNAQDGNWDGSGGDIILTPGSKGGGSLGRHGRVGIGTTSPSGIFEVQGGTAASGAGGSIMLNAQAGNWDGSGGDIILTPGSKGGGSLGRHGRVGIGTTSPSGIFEVQGGTATSGDGAPIYLKAQNNAWDGQGGDILLIPGSQSGGSSRPGRVGIGTTSPSGIFEVQGGTAPNGAGAPIYLKAQNNAWDGQGGDILLIPGDQSGGSSRPGRVGIGTTSPSGLLHVAGATSIFGAGEGAAPSASTIRGANAAGTDVAGANLTIQAGNGTGTGGSGAIYFQTAPVGATSSSANSLATVMTVAKSGNVGIGTTSPTATLSVNGAINSSLVTVAFSATPTYNADLGNTFKMTLTGNVTGGTLTNADAGQRIVLIYCQDATGGRTIVLPSNFKRDGPWSPGSAANKCATAEFIFDGTNAYQLGSTNADM